VTYYPCFDGNGNITEYINASGAIVAHFEYDPFGNTPIITGAQAQEFKYRFSTKPLENTTGLYYYGYRYYHPQTGRWINRDPIEENGGLNLYGIVKNNSIDNVDVHGLVEMNLIPKCIKQKADSDSIDRIFNPVNGYYNICAHGSPINIVDSNGASLSAESLAALVCADEKYDKKPIKLWACLTGADVNSDVVKKNYENIDKNFAQKLANVLCVPVRAPKGLLEKRLWADRCSWYFQVPTRNGKGLRELHLISHPEEFEELWETFQPEEECECPCKN
jgi:RHS repeat-associated protein